VEPAPGRIPCIDPMVAKVSTRPPCYINTSKLSDRWFPSPMSIARSWRGPAYYVYGVSVRCPAPSITWSWPQERNTAQRKMLCTHSAQLHGAGKEYTHFNIDGHRVWPLWYGRDKRPFLLGAGQILGKISDHPLHCTTEEIMGVYKLVVLQQFASICGCTPVWWLRVDNHMPPLFLWALQAKK